MTRLLAVLVAPALLLAVAPAALVPKGKLRPLAAPLVGTWGSETAIGRPFGFHGVLLKLSADGAAVGTVYYLTGGGVAPPELPAGRTAATVMWSASHWPSAIRDPGIRCGTP